MNSQTNIKSRFILIVLGFSMVAFSLFISYRFLSEKRKPRKQNAVSYVPSVEVIKVKPGGNFINIHAMGKIKPHENISLKSEVQGKIIYTSPRFQDDAPQSKSSYLVTFCTFQELKF